MANNDDLNSSHPENSQEQGEVQILPPEERENFKGITIDAGEQEKNNQDYSEYEYHDPHKRVYVRRVNLKGGLFNWVVLGLLFVVAIFIALPFLLFIIIPMVIVIFLSNLLRRH